MRPVRRRSRVLQLCALIALVLWPVAAYAAAAPTISITPSPGPGSHGSQNVTIVATDHSGSGIDALVYSLDDGEFVQYHTPFTITRPGAHTVTARALDGLGGLAEESAPVLVTTDSALRVTPVQGYDRITTAVEASRRAFPQTLDPDPDGYRTVVLSTAFNWPDALGAASLAGALDAPILLTQQDRLPSSVAAEMVRLGADRVIIVGGPRAVDDAVATTCADVPGVDAVERISGADRYATAIALADRSIGLQADSFRGRAFIATGADFPDALSASGIAAAKGMPVYLTAPGSVISNELRRSLVAGGVHEAVILGGSRAVSDDVASQIASTIGSVPLRISGGTRYETSLATARWGVESGGMFWDGVALTTGLSFPDAIAGGPLQGRSASVTLLTDPKTLGVSAFDTLRENRYLIGELRFLGGESALSEDVRARAETALER